MRGGGGRGDEGEVYVLVEKFEGEIEGWMGYKVKLIVQTPLGRRHWHSVGYRTPECCAWDWFTGKL